MQPRRSARRTRTTAPPRAPAEQVAAAARRRASPRASWSRRRSRASRPRQPTLNAFRVIRAEAALAEADEADRRLAAGEGAPLLGVPVAIKDDMDLAGDTDPLRLRRLAHARPMRDAEVVRRLRAAGAIVIGKTNAPEVGPVAVHRGARVRRDPQPLEPRPHARRLQRRRGGGGRRRAGPGRDRLRRRRLGPHPRRLDRPRRPQAAARPDLHLARPRGLQRAHLLSARSPAPSPTPRCCSTRSAATSRPTCTSPPPPARALRRGRRPRARPAADRALLRDPVRRPGQARPRAPRGDRGLRRAARGARPRGRARRSRLRPGRPGHHAPRRWPGSTQWLSGTSTTARSSSRAPGRTPASAACSAGLPLRGVARGRAGAARAASAAIFQRFDVVLTPTTAKPPPRIGAIDGRGYWATDNAAGAACPYAWPGTCSAGRASASPPGSPRPGCRSAPSCSARKTARRCCLLAGSVERAVGGFEPAPYPRREA